MRLGSQQRRSDTGISTLLKLRRLTTPYSPADIAHRRHQIYQAVLHQDKKCNCEGDFFKIRGLEDDQGAGCESDVTKVVESLDHSFIMCL